MALIKCPDCGTEVSDAAAACPKCARPISAKPVQTRYAGTQTVRTRPATSPVTWGCLTIILLGLAVGIVPIILGPGGGEPAQVAASAPFAFQEVESWDIPAGGRGRVLVIDSARSNEADLRALGDFLRAEMAPHLNAVVMVYDSDRAARMRRQVESLPRRDQIFHDDHRMAIYTKNGSTGHHSLVISPEGIDGDDPMTTIPYPAP
jgi:DNA-directed RNA polymerase subunit RPC12/RpoP